jgi:hypothetical protein
LKGQARTYADYLVGAVKRLGLSNMPQKHAADARAMGLGHPDDMPVKKERKPKQARQPKPKVPEAPKRSEVKPDYEKIDRHVLEYRQALEDRQLIKEFRDSLSPTQYASTSMEVQSRLKTSISAIDAEMAVYRKALLKSGMPKADADKAVDTVSISGLSESRKTSLKRGLSEFYQLTNGGASDVLKTIVYDNPRAYANEEAGKINIGKGSSKDRITLFHEVGHFAETSDMRVSNNDWISVVKSEDGRLYRLSDLTRSKAYTENEVAYKDAFISPYVGKTYGGGNRPTEVLSMGLQYFTNAKNMTDLYIGDSSHFKRMEAYLNDRRNISANI